MEIKFPLGSFVRHLKTGRLYKILGTPDKCRIEKDWVPAYRYGVATITCPADMEYPEVIRPQIEMEDGRFELVQDSDLLEFVEIRPVSIETAMAAVQAAKDHSRPKST